jgi:hypothetical protein
LRVRRNYPYAGKADGLTAYLRRLFPGAAYLGVELEVNQQCVRAPRGDWLALRRLLVDTLMLHLT